MSAFGNYEVVSFPIESLVSESNFWVLEVDAPEGKVFLGSGNGEVSPGVIYFQHPVNDGTSWKFAFTSQFAEGTIYLTCAEMGC